MKRLVLLFAHKLRLSNPWRYKAPSLMACTYFVMALTEFSWQKGLLSFGMACATIIGIAGFGYFLNDFSDREEDRKAGKANVLIGMKSGYVMAILMVLLSFAVLPWVFFFPLDRLSIILLISEFAMFALYSLPPFRFKERGFLGVLADASYAHMIPAVLAAHTFGLMADAHFEYMEAFLIILGGWQMAWGMRNILLHQQGDLAKDISTGTKTFGVNVGGLRLAKWLQGMIVVEILGFATFLGFLGFFWWFCPLFYLLFLAQVLYFRLIAWKIGLPESTRERLSTFIDEFYNAWLPIFPLAVLVWFDPMFLILTLLHVLLFPNAVFRMTRQIAGMFGIKFLGE